MDVADADRTQEGRPALREDEDIVAALRTSKLTALDPYTVEDAVATTPALPSDDDEPAREDDEDGPTREDGDGPTRPDGDGPTRPEGECRPDGTQEIHVDDVLEVLEGKRRLPPPPPPAHRASLTSSASIAPVDVPARAPAERTQEIRAVDILEEVSVAPRSAARATVATVATVPPARASADIAIDIDEEPMEERKHTASSIAPLAIEVDHPVIVRKPEPSFVEASSSASFVARIGPPRRLRAIVEITMAASLLILAAGALRAHFTPSEGDAEPIVMVDGNGTSRASAAAPPPAVDVKSLPTAATAPTTGTIARTTSAKLTVDGVPISGVSAMVPCGPHLIKVGTDKARKLDVPCGGTLSVDPQRR